MKKIIFSALFMSVFLGGCDNGPPVNSAEEMVENKGIPEGEIQNKFGFWEAQEQGGLSDLVGGSGPSAKALTDEAIYRAESNAGGAQPSETTAAADATDSGSNIAYTYDFGFAIEQEKIPELQQEHVAVCESLGPKCRILRLSQAGTDGFDGYGELRLQVAANDARAFGDSLSAPAEALGGEQVSFVVAGEDLSETLIDTKAKLQSRLILRAKLTAILRNNRGSVDELVKAEKAVAEVNEEIDANQSKLKELGNRIEFSKISIEYNPYLGETSAGFARPVAVAFQSIGTTLGTTIAVLIYIATALIPITIFLLGLRWLWRKSGMRIRRKESDAS